MRLFGIHIVSEREWRETQQRLLDIESHFAVERDAKTGAMTKSLADVPVEERKNLKKNLKMRGGSWNQLRRYLEETDGGRLQ